MFHFYDYFPCLIFQREELSESVQLDLLDVLKESNVLSRREPLLPRVKLAVQCKLCEV